MQNRSSIKRIVPNIYADDIEKSKKFYLEFLDMKLAMDMGWILTFTSKDNETAQVSIFKNEGNKPLNNAAIFISIEVEDVDYMHQKANFTKADNSKGSIEFDNIYFVQTKENQHKAFAWITGNEQSALKKVWLSLTAVAIKSWRLN